MTTITPEHMLTYPRALRNYPGKKDYKGRIIHIAPKQLFCEGNECILNEPTIAIIGTRHPSPLGVRIAYAMAAHFAKEGYVILSGLAEGCDTAAHQGALSVGGRTVAVLAKPLNNIYPESNIELSKQIVRNGGLLVTEYNDRPRDRDEGIDRFIKRDYLQAALSLCVIPIQGGIKSGTRHACNTALEIGRLLALPFPVESDYQRHKDRYDLIFHYHYMKDVHIVPIISKKDYPFIAGLVDTIWQQFTK